MPQPSCQINKIVFFWSVTRLSWQFIILSFLVKKQFSSQSINMIIKDWWHWFINVITIEIFSRVHSSISPIQVYFKQDLRIIDFDPHTTHNTVLMAAKTDQLLSQSSVLLCIDLQTCYYQPPITELFPKLEQNVRNVLGFCRDSKVQVVHVRQEDLRGRFCRALASNTI